MYVIFANVNFVPGKHDEWIAAYKELEGYVEKHEKETCLTYYFGIPEFYGKDFSRSHYMLAYEAYEKKEDLYDTHLHSKPMGVFLSKVPPLMLTGLDLPDYEVVAGFLDKADMKECGVIWDTRLSVQPGKQQEVIKRLTELASWVEKNETDTYTFLVHRGLGNENDIRILERYATRTALEKHQTCSQVLDFFMLSKDLIRSVEGHGYIPNGLGWLHR